MPNLTTSETLTFRDATLEDLPLIVEIYNSTIPTRKVTADLDPITPESRIGWFHNHNRENRPLWIVTNHSGKTVGWASFQSFYGRPAYNKTVEISIYLSPDQRQKGYGREILKHCLNTAPSLGIQSVLAFIFAQNSDSLKLFRRFGFEDWGILPDIAELDGRKETLYILGKKVS